MAEAIYLTDMSVCLPQSALSTTPQRHKWQVVAYTAEEGLAGKMAFAHALYETPAITLPLNVEGWHAFSIGFWPGVEQEHTSLVKYRLSGEAVYTVVEHYVQSPSLPGCFWDRTELVETFPRYADLTGQDLLFSKQNTAHPPTLACVAYVKLAPLTQTEVEAIERDREQRETRRVVGMIDGEGLFHQKCPATKEELQEQIEPFRYADVGKVLWGVNLSDLTYYHSKVGRFYGTEDGVCPVLRHEHALKSHKALADQGIVPFAAAMEYAHELGVEFHTYYRLSIVDKAQPYFFFSTETRFLRDNPDCRIVAKDDSPLMKASYAFPKVRDFMVSLIEEAMEYDIDGVHLCFTRGPEYIGYEQPVLDDFRRLYGQDPRDVADDDERLYKVKANYLTEFLRAVRKTADQHGDRRGRKMKVSAIFEGGKEDMRYFAYDAYTWVKEKLVDFIITNPPADLVRLAQENGCQVYMVSTKEDKALTMKHAYAAGMDGMAIWDINTTRPETWAIESRLGHRDEVIDLPKPEQYPKMKRTRLITIRGRDFSQTVDKNVPSGWPPELLVIYTGG